MSTGRRGATAPVKKRTPKPPINYATHSLLEFIPFLNCDPGKPGEMIGHIVSRMETWAGVDDDFIWRWEKKGAVIEEIRETQSDIKTLLVDPINQPIIDRMNRFISGLSPVVSSMGRALMTAFMQPAENYNPEYKCLAVSLRPRGSDRDFFMDAQGFADFDKIWVPGFRAMLYILIAEAFEVANILNRKRSNVSFYIGLCKKCGIVYEKKRGDQEYCGKSCANMASRARK